MNLAEPSAALGPWFLSANTSKPLQQEHPALFLQLGERASCTNKREQ